MTKEEFDNFGFKKGMKFTSSKFEGKRTIESVNFGDKLSNKSEILLCGGSDCNWINYREIEYYDPEPDINSKAEELVKRFYKIIFQDGKILEIIEIESVLISIINSIDNLCKEQESNKEFWREVNFKVQSLTLEEFQEIV